MSKEKRSGTTRAEGMYSWTRQILDDQIAFNLRQSRTHAHAKSLRCRVSPDGPKLPYPAAARDESNAAPATASACDE